MAVALTLVWTAESNQEVSSFARTVAPAGDVNGDGYDDVVVGAPQYTNVEGFEGRAYLFLGSATGLGDAAAWTAESNQAQASFGRSVAAADVNGDGFSDLLIGATSFDNGELQEGRAHVFLGSATGPSAVADWTFECDQEGATLGVMSGAGDVNGDGYEDVLVGASGYDGAVIDEGLLQLFLGSDTGLAVAPIWVATSGQSGSGFANAASAGDVDGDGYDDVVVAAYNFDSATVDGGRVFLYRGSPTGLEATPSWTALSNQAAAHLGDSIAMGDVNADGYDDLVVGASAHDEVEVDEGRVVLFLGSATGLSLSPDWAVQPNLAGVLFGTSVSVPGDVNGDGFGDLVVSATAYDGGQTDEGRVFVYLGTATVPATTPAWTAESDQQASMYGFTQSGAGDVNGDGFADVIVGAYRYDNGTQDEGQAFLYEGAGDPPQVDTDPPPPPLATADTGDSDADVHGDGAASSGCSCAAVNGAGSSSAWMMLLSSLGLVRRSRASR